MRIQPGFVRLCAAATFTIGVFLFAVRGAGAAAVRPQGPCDLYAAANTPCVAAHSTVRALYASYNGPLYQVKRASDGRTLDIGVVRGMGNDAGGYANAAAQDVFCGHTICVINRIYDQSGHGNDLMQAAPGTFKGPAKGGFDTQPIADMAPVTIGGHEAYGVFIMPGMGFRNNNASGLAIGDEAEGIYSVADGTHYDSGCCFDYGNSSTNGRAVGTGTMETTYFGTSTVWGSGSGPGPWVMADMEAGLFSGQGARKNAADPTIDSWRFVTAVVDGGGGNHWDLRGGDAQRGGLTTFYSGERPAASRSGGYFPMHKKGGILLGTGGDNGNGSAGTFYEGAMTTGSPAIATTDAVQANVVAARYQAATVALSRMTSFTPGSTQQVTATFTNTTGAPLQGVRLSVAGPNAQWKAVAEGTRRAGAIAAGASVPEKFRVTSPATPGAGVLTAGAQWKAAGVGSARAVARVRNVLPVKINEVGFGSGAEAAGQFVELYNASDRAADLSGWSLVATASQGSPEGLATIPAGTRLAGHRFYLLGLAGSGLAAPANAGDTTISVRSTAGLAAGQTIGVDGETRRIAKVGTQAAPATMIFVPVSTGPWLTLPVGTTSLPVESAAGFEVGQRVAIDAGGSGYEVATVTGVGKAATQTTLRAAASAGANAVKLAADADVSVGDTLTIDTGAHEETAKVASVDAGVGVGLTAPLRLEHASGVDVSDAGSGIAIAPATRFAHRSADAVQALGSGIALDRPLARSHAGGSAVMVAETAAGAWFEPGSAPEQWFGASLSPSAGSLALLDASGTEVVDAMVYGSQQSNSSGNGTIASPELAVLEGDQRQGGCIAVVPRASGAAWSLGRYPDGADTYSNCSDFHTQAVAALAAGAAAGATNLKVTSVDGFAAGQSIEIGSAGELETAAIAAVGTPGAAVTSAAVAAGATTIPLANGFAFRPGQVVTIGQETAVVAAGGRRGTPMVTLEAPLKSGYAAGTEVAGSGITLASPLTRAHAAGAAIADHQPTPGGANRYTVWTDLPLLK